MKANQYSFNIYQLLVASLFITIISGFSYTHAQCPTVTNTIQSFCDVESILVGDLQATDNGGGVVWYESATSTTPLSNTDNLIHGEDYFADDNSGSCGVRVRVDVIVYSAPIGDHFQGFCLDDPTLATVGDLVATGNNVNWYLTASGGIPLNDSDILIDDTIYYADQENPDTGCRTSRLSVLVKVGNTPIPTGDMVQQFCSTPSFTPTIGDLVASGTNNWYFSLYSALPLSLDEPLINGHIYYATTLDPPCESSGRLPVMVVLDNGPNAGNDGVLDLCIDETTSTVDLFTMLGGSPDAGGTWSPELASGTGVFDPSVDPDGVYTYTLNSGNSCPDDSATVTVTSAPLANAGTNGTLEICSINDPVDLFDSLGGSPELGGVWSPALTSGTGIFDPAEDAFTTYTYTIAGTAPCPDATATVEVLVTPYKDAGEDGFIELCDSSQTINLFDSLGGTPDTGGTWSPSLTSGTGIFDPAVDAEGVYTYSFPDYSPCINEAATVTVTVNELPTAGSNTTLQICSNDLSSIDLFANLGGSPEVGGTWTPALASGTNIFDPSVDLPGTFTYTLAGTDPCPDVSATVTILLIEEPNAGLDAVIDICSNNGIVDLFDILGGTPDTGGTWSPILASGTGIFDPNVDTEGTYTYTVPGTTPCSDATATVSIQVTPFLNAGTNGSITLCTNDNAVDLFDILGGSPDLGGTWSPTLTSGTGIFDPSIDTAGSYTYTITGSEQCSDSSATIEVVLEMEPDAGSNGTLDLCGLTTTADLFESLEGTPQTGGTWSPSLASGTGVFDPNVDAEGTYTYTINSNCGTSSASVLVTVSDPISAGINGSVELCFNDAIIDLFDSLGGTPQEGGTWSPALASGTSHFDPSIDAAGTYTYTVSNSETSCPDDSATVIVSVIEEPNAGNDGNLSLCNSTETIDLFDGLTGMPQTGGSWSPTLSSGTGIFDPNVDAEGSYTYSVTNSCGTSSATVTITVSNTNDAGTDGSIELCFNDTAVNLFNSLGGTPQAGGTWSPALSSGSGVFDPNIDTAGTYTYTVSDSDSDCPEASATVFVSVSQDPNAGNDGIINLCGFTEVLNLFDGLTGSPQTGGVWSPALSSGTGAFNPNIDPEGIYTYTVSNSCGSSSATVEISIATPNNAGTNGSIQMCSNDMAVNLFDSLGGTPQEGGTWSPELASGTGVFDPSIDAPGTYTYTVSNEESFCPEASATVVVTISEAPNAGTDSNINLCSDVTDSVDLFESLGGSPDEGGTWSPALASGTSIFDPTIDTAGVYIYTVSSDECNESNSASVTVSILELPDVTGLTMTTEDDVICLGEEAAVDITNALFLQNGDYSIVYQLSGANVSVNTIPITIVDGNASFTIPQILLQNTGTTVVTLTQLYVLDQNCSAYTDLVRPVTILVQQVPTPEIIENGSEFCLEDNPTFSDLSNNIVEGDSIVWYDHIDGGVAYSDSDLLQDGETYYASIVTDYGCESEIRLEVTVSLIQCIKELLIPDGFSPNGDGINDVFDILYLNELYPNFKLSIYNRYGNILYEGDINSPKWDGTGKGNTQLPVGVYFYILEFNDGEREPLQGRVYLSR